MFRDKRYGDVFATKGYVKLGLLSITEVEKALLFFRKFEEIHREPNLKFKGTGWIENYQLRRSISEKLGNLLRPTFEKHFSNYELLGCGFLLKEPGADSAVPLHQDWTYVDENAFFSVNVWIALEDIDQNNGCLHMVPGSHSIGKYLRPSPSYPVPFRNILSLLERLKKPVHLKAGEGVCFDHRTIHGSYPNLSNSFRLAIVATLYPSNAQLLHHYVHDKIHPQTITEYEIHPKDFITLTRGQPPQSYFTIKAQTTTYPLYRKITYSLRWMTYFFKSLIM